MSNYAIRTATWEADKELLLTVRYAVFVDEQSVPIELECDEDDATALHWLATDNAGNPIGTARMLVDGRIGRLAVLKAHRGENIGKALMLAMIENARQQNLMETYLTAQTRALDFYHKLGFDAEGEEFMDAGIAHLTMRKRLFEQRILGTHGGNFPVIDLKKTAIDMVSQTQGRLRILSYDLDHDVFDNDSMSELISSLARKSRYTEIRILVVNTQPMVKRRHRLLTLKRRLSSIIGLRTVSCDPTDVKENLIIADDVGIICQSILDNEKIWGNFNNRPIATNYTTQFDDLWNRGVEDRNVRQLDI